MTCCKTHFPQSFLVSSSSFSFIIWLLSCCCWTTWLVALKYWGSLSLFLKNKMKYLFFFKYYSALDSWFILLFLFLVPLLWLWLQPLSPSLSLSSFNSRYIKYTRNHLAMNAPPTSDSEAPGTPCWPLTKPQKTIYIIMCVCVYLRVYTGNNTNTRRISHWEKWKEKKLFFWENFTFSQR